MSKGLEGNRFLLTAAVSRYLHDPTLDRPEIAEDVTRIAGLLTRDFGYTHKLLAESPTLAQLRDGLRGFCRAAERRPDDVIAVYLVCHGTILEPGDFVFLPSDIDPEDPLPRAVTSQTLVDWLMRDTKVQRLLLMIDACYSGQGARDAAQAVVRWVHQPGAVEQPGVVLVTATHPWQTAQPGVFTTAFERAVEHLASGGYAQKDLPLDAVVGVINADPDVPKSQTVTCHKLGLTGAPPPFLPNPRYQPLLVDVDLLEQERARHAQQRTENLRDRFLPAIRWFTGRHAALDRATRWLKSTAESPLLVVTGNAGSGKTAMLGLLAALADPDHRPSVGRDGLPRGLDVWEDAISEAIYAGTMTSSQVRDRIAAAMAIRADTTSELIKGLLRRKGNAQVILIDALDEAADPSDLIRGLLNPLIKECLGQIRLILGTRPYLLTNSLLGKPNSGPYVLVDLDSEEYTDPPSIRAYIRRILLSSDSLDSAYLPSGLYTSAHPTVLDDITDAIAEAAGSSFLVARIAAATETTASRLPDPADLSWRAALPRHAGEAMRRDLRLRLGEDAEKAAQLLLPLAYAQGGGMPWENVWPRLSDALSPGHNYGNEDLIWLRRAAGSYAVEGLVGGRSVYRLYHQALAEYLLQGRDLSDDQQTITRTLIGLIPPADGTRLGWGSAHPYIRAHLATHAARGGCLDPLLDDPDYLQTAARPQLNSALSSADSNQARRHGFTYRRVTHHLNTKPHSEWASYLELAARCNSAPILADRISTRWPDRPWCVRWASWRPVMQPLYTVSGHSAAVHAVAVIELQGRPVVVSGGADKSVRAWDLVTGTAVGKPFTGHSAAVHAVAVIELQGRPVVVSGGADKSVRAWDMETGTEIGQHLVGNSAVHAVAIAELNNRLTVVLGCADGTTQVWDLESATQVHNLASHSTTVHTVTVAELHNRRVVISGSVSGDVGIWDLETGVPIGQPFTNYTAAVLLIDADDLRGRPFLITRTQDLARLKESRQGNRLVVNMWDLEGRTAIGKAFDGHATMVREAKVAQIQGQLIIASESHDNQIIVWSPDLTASATQFTGARRVAATVLTELQGRPVVAMGNRNGSIEVWDLEAVPHEENAFAGFSRGVSALAVTQLQGRTIVAVGRRDGIIQLWDLETAVSIRQFGRHESAVLALATTQLHGQPVAISGSADGTLRVWDLETGEMVGLPFGDHTLAVHTVAVADCDGHPIIVSGSRGTVKIWDLETGVSAGRPFTGHAAAVHALAVSNFHGRPIVISAGADRSIQVWDMRTATAIGSPLTSYTGEVHALAVAELQGRQVVLSGGTDHKVWIWDLESSAPIGLPLTGHTGYVMTLAVAEVQGRQVIISGSSDHSVRIWDLQTGKAVVLHNSAHTSWVRTVAIAELNGRVVVVSGGDDSWIIARDLDTGVPVGQHLTRHAEPLCAVAAAVVGGRQVVVTGGEDHTVRVWDLGTGAAFRWPFTGHSGPVRSVAVTELHGHPVVVSGSDDRSVRLWDIETGLPIGKPFTRHRGMVTAVAVGKFGGRPLVVSADGRGFLAWDLETGELAGPPFTCQWGPVSVLAITEVKGKPIVLSGVGRTVIAWDPETGDIWQRFRGLEGPVNALGVDQGSMKVVMLANGSSMPINRALTAVHPLRYQGIRKLVTSLQSELRRSTKRDGGGLAHLNKPDREVVAYGSEIMIRGGFGSQVIDIGTTILGLVTSPPNCIIAISAQGLVVLDVAGPDPTYQT